MSDKTADGGGSKKADKPKPPVKEKEDRLRERERKKEQENLENALEASRKDAAKPVPGSSNKEPRPSSSRAFERDAFPYQDNLRSEFSTLGNILSNGFSSLRQEFSGLKCNLSEGFSSINGNLETGFEALYYGDEAEEDKCGEVAFPLESQTTSCLGMTSVAVDPIPEAEDDNDVTGCGPALTCAVGSEERNAVSLFAKLAGEISIPSETSADVGADLARLVNEFCSRPLSLDEFNELKKKYKRPGNCPQLQVPFVPEVIWSHLDGAFRGRDKAWQSVQEDFVSITSAHIIVMQMLDDALVTWDEVMKTFITAFPVAVLDSIKELTGSVSKAILTMMDAAKMAGYLHRTGITERRREALKPKLPGDFKHLAGTNFGPTETSLFGNIVDNVKVISETAKLSSQMDAATKKPTPGNSSGFNRNGARFAPYGRGRGQGFFTNRRGRGRGRFPRGSGRGFNFGQSSSGQATQGTQENHAASRQGFRGRGAPQK